MSVSSTIKKTERYRGRLSRQARVTEGHVPSKDGTSIYYHSVGRGSPIVCCNGLGVSTFFWKKLERAFSPHAQVVTWDYRGHGRSADPKDLHNCTTDDLVADLKAVLDALDIQKAILFGHSYGVQVILEFYRQYPKRVRALVLGMGTYGRPLDTFYNFPLSRSIIDVICRFTVLFPALGNWVGRLLLDNPASFYIGGLLKVMNTALMPKEAAEQYIRHITRLDAVFFAYLCQNAQEHSAESVLPHISVPTLIFAGEDDTFTPLWLSKKMHRLIPDSELCVVRKGSHAALVEQPDLINLRLEKFIQDRVNTGRRHTRDFFADEARVSSQRRSQNED